MPPKVKSIDKNGSSIKKYFNFLLIEVVAKIKESKKKITDSDKI